MAKSNSPTGAAAPTPPQGGNDPAAVNGAEHEREGALPTSVFAEPIERELIISIIPDWSWVRYEGTSAQLEAEGLIPEGFKWPRAAVDQRWDLNGFNYWLRRERPEGHKGPIGSWWEMDNWVVRVTMTGQDNAWLTRRQLEREAEALRAKYHRLTVAGEREWRENWNRFSATCRDSAFQQFKARVPGLIPPKRGRKPKADKPAA